MNLKDEKEDLFINELLVNNVPTKDINLILTEIHNFYQELYQKRSESMHMDLEDFLKNIPSIPKIKADTSNLVGPITDREVEDAIGWLRNNKSPGFDGLTAEFYKHFCEEITPILTLTFNKIFEQKKLAPSQRLAIIILLFKKGDARYLTNYKPISLTNADYKILAYILTSRLDTHLSDITAVNQMAYMKGHFIGYNIKSI